MPKSIFGTQAASIGGVPAFMANVADMVCNIIYRKLRASPKPRYIPIPPFLFLEDKEAPMMVRMNEANELAMRL